MRLRTSKWLIAALGALAAGIAWRSDHLLFELPARAAERHAEKLSNLLAERHGLVLLLDFDPPRPIERVGRKEVDYAGTERAATPLGFGRRFDGHPHTHLSTQASWSDLGPAYTLSLWLNLEPSEADQDIWYTAAVNRRTGFRWSRGHLSLFVPGGEEQMAAIPYPAHGRFAHLAAVVEGPGKEARLYLDGQLMVSFAVAKVDHPPHNMEFGKMRWWAANAPFRGTLDEAAAWNRALSPPEIAALAAARQPLLKSVEPARTARLRLAEIAGSYLPLGLKMLDRFNVFLHEPRSEAADLPEIHLHLSSSDARHFLRVHEQSLASGRRVNRGANPRRIHVQLEHATLEARARLAGSTTRYPQSRRFGLVLDFPQPVNAFQSTSIRLLPPESLDDPIRQLAVQTRTTTLAGLCRLSINGQFKGIYHWENFDLGSNYPSGRSWVAEGTSHPMAWRSMFRRETDPSGTLRRTTGQESALRLERIKRLLAQDLHHPWSVREWDWRIKEASAGDSEESSLDAWAASLSPFDLLGDNPAPFYLIGSLDLSSAIPSDTLVSWTSSHPDLIDSAGRVVRPEGDVPVEVVLTATAQRDGRTASQSLRFRVVPTHPRLPALLLAADEPFSKTRRTDVHALYFPAGNAGPARRLHGGQGTRGGIKHRGNTSYWRGAVKKPLSLRFDEPHHLLDSSETRHLYLLNGYHDTTLMRNKLCYDLFRAFGDPPQNRHSPVVEWSEVFINGVYFGLYELCTRVHAEMLADERGFTPDEEGAALYKMRAPATLFTNRELREFDQVLPPPRKRLFTDPLLDFVDFVAQADGHAFAEGIGDRLDLDNAVDFLLLLNFAENLDGRTTNFYLACGAPPEGRMFFIPWDYDKTFMGGSGWLSNHLFNRLRSERPGFDERLARRWQNLRQGVLSNASVLGRIAAMEQALAGYAEPERVWMGLAAAGESPSPVERLKANALKRLHRIDQAFPAVDGEEAPHR